MPSPRINRRDFVALAGSSSLMATLAVQPVRAKQTARANDAEPVPDSGWRLWIDEQAPWQDDAIYLPEDADLAVLPVNPPSGGWDRLSGDAGIAITLPSTVEQHLWGKFGTRSYAADEFTYATSDPVPQNGAWRGVSWWWREIDIPAAFRGKRIILSVRGARLRAEVYLNEKLVGYSILEELPFDCDLTEAAVPGGKNLLAIRITNPGGRYDWVDGDTIQWGKAKLQRSHGFGGLDRGLMLSAHPMDGRIADLWVLNTPEKRTVHVFAKLEGVGGHLTLSLTEERSGRAVLAQIRDAGTLADGTRKFVVTAKGAKLWDLNKPHLYRLAARWTAPGREQSRRSTAFGFRWFAPDGLGKNALLRFNGRRIKLYSAISWGYWGLNGLWPTPELAEKEVTQAKALGLNCLSFHRNVGKADVLAAQDRLGLLRYMEPGGGKLAIGTLPKGAKVDAPDLIMSPPGDAADEFCRRYMVAKCKAMVRAFRSHPSLIQYTLQNEAGADLGDPATIAILAAMREEDESRTILLNDRFSSLPRNAAQAWYAPYDPAIHRSDKEPWGGWWDDHQGAGDQWYDEFYQDPEHFNYRQTLAAAIVEFGEMEGCAVPDNHVQALAEIAARGGTSYDLQDRREIVAAYDTFLDRWGFRRAFPTVESLFLAIGRKSYDSWQQYMENARINDATDIAVISGWESTSIDNHSGLVDNLRNFKSDPKLIRTSLLPIRPVAKQRRLVVGLGESAVFDLFLLNDTGVPAPGKLVFTMTDPAGKKTKLGAFACPRMGRDQFRALIEAGFSSPPLSREGAYRFTFALSGMAYAAQTREIFVANAQLPPGRILRVGVAGVWDRLRRQLAAVPGITVSDFTATGTYDAVISSGLTEQSTPGQKLGGDAGLDLQKVSGMPPVPGALPQEMIAVVNVGTPLLVMAQEDGLADGVATQLSALGAFRYDGQVGKLRAPWMGNWYFLREHPVYAGLPSNQAMGVYHQAHGRQANGLLIDGADVDVFVGYSRDHDRKIGAGTFTAKLGTGKIVFQRVPDLNGPMQLRFLRNALTWLCG
jgi:beta-galactosidase